MLNLTVFIAHYSDKNNQYLFKVIENFSKYSSFSIDLIIDYAASDLPVKQLLKDYPTLNLHFIKHDNSIRENLVFSHRDSIIKGLWCDVSDYILYCEDDILIPEIALLTAIKYETENKVCGFLRYEEKNNERILIDLNKSFPTIKNIFPAYFTLHNLHQGCWFLNQKTVKNLIEKLGSFFYI